MQNPLCVALQLLNSSESVGAWMMQAATEAASTVQAAFAGCTHCCRLGNVFLGGSKISTLASGITKVVVPK